VIEPLVPADVDLRDFAFMPLDVVRLRDSSLSIEASGDEFRAAVLLWCVAWHQVPAASLPDDDRALAMYTGFGRDVKGWKRIRAGAIRGFVQCSDGRLYHPILAEKAMEAAGRKESGSNRNARQQRWRERMREIAEELREHGVTPQAGASIKDLEALLVDARFASTVDANVDEPNTSTSTSTETSTSIDRQGQGQEKTEEKKEKPQAAFEVPEWINREAWDGYAEMRRKKRAPLTPRACAMVVKELAKLLAAGQDPATVLDQSTRNCWTDVYPLKAQQAAANNGKSQSRNAPGATDLDYLMAVGK
jgi:O-methyltransferase involved in polyketide biosynthesis